MRVLYVILMLMRQTCGYNESRNTVIYPRRCGDV